MRRARRIVPEIVGCGSMNSTAEEIPGAVDDPSSTLMLDPGLNRLTFSVMYEEMVATQQTLFGRWRRVPVGRRKLHRGHEADGQTVTFFSPVMVQETGSYLSFNCYGKGNACAFVIFDVTTFDCRFIWLRSDVGAVAFTPCVTSRITRCVYGIHVH